MISQMDYDNYQPSAGYHESTTERELRRLRRRVDEMEAEKVGMTVEELEEKRLAEHYAAIAQQQPRETAAMASIRLQMEARRRADEGWLAAWGVPGDAGDDLKAVVLNLRCHLSQNAIIGLVAACSGEELSDSEPTGRQMVRMFPNLAPGLQKAFVQAAVAFAHLRNQVPFNG